MEKMTSLERFSGLSVDTLLEFHRKLGSIGRVVREAVLKGSLDLGPPSYPDRGRACRS